MIPHPITMLGTVDGGDDTIVWDDTPFTVYWNADGSNSAGADNSIYFYENTAHLSPASAVGITGRINQNNFYVPTIDPGSFGTGEYVVKWEKVTLVSGDWSNMWIDYTASKDGVWYDLFRQDIRNRDYGDDATVQHFIVDITIATDNGAGSPVAGTEVTKRVTFYADYGNSRNVRDLFTGTTGTAITAHTPNTDTEGGGWVIDAGTPELYSGHLVGGASGEHRCVIDTGHADSICRAQLMADSNGGSSQPLGLIFRRQDSNDYWKLVVEDAETSNPVLKIIEVNSGTPTTQDSVTMTGIGPLDGEDCYIQIECNGNVLDGYFDGPFPTTPDNRFSVTYTSSSMNTETYYGIIITGDGSTGTGARADDFATKQAPGSAFDQAIAALSPNLWYKFDSGDDFSGTVIDHGSLGEDISSNGAVDATAGTAMRSTKTQSIQFPSYTAGNWATQGAQYADSTSNPIAEITDGVPLTIVMSIEHPDAAGNQTMFAGVGVNYRSVTTGNAQWQCYSDGASRVEFWKRHATGSTAVNTDTETIAGNGPQLVVWRLGISGDTSKQEVLCNDVQGEYGNRVGYCSYYSHPFIIGGYYSGSEPGPVWRSDCFALFTKALTDAELTDLWNKYNAEI